MLDLSVTSVCTAQSILPFLWRDGHLGGRRFDVLMTRLPLYHLHAILDEALAAHPDRRVLGEYRAPATIVEAEADALSAAQTIITPHPAVAALFPGRARLLEWKIPARSDTSAPRLPGREIVFPGPTAARKGAYELRAVARALNLEVALFGAELEGDGFWRGVSARRIALFDRALSLENAAAVVQPALIEDNPRLLLRASAAGVPLIVTPACGLPPGPGVTVVPYGDEAALQSALQKLVAVA